MGEGEARQHVHKTISPLGLRGTHWVHEHRAVVDGEVGVGMAVLPQGVSLLVSLLVCGGALANWGVPKHRSS